MKILFTVEFYEPRKGGAEEVVRQLAERLAKNGHTVTVATSVVTERKVSIINGVIIASFALKGNMARGIHGSPKEIECYQNLLRGDFDVVFNYAAQIWTTDLAFAVLDSMKAKKVLIPCGYSGLQNPAFREYFEELPLYLAKYDKIIYLSPGYQDKVFGDTHGFSSKGVVIPNGAAEEEFLSPEMASLKATLGIKEKYLLISVSNHYVAKGHAFIIKAFKEMKHKDATLIILGTPLVSSGLRRVYHVWFDYLHCYCAAFFNRRIRLVNGNSRQFVVSAYRNADMFLFGSRVECAPLVMYESFAGKTFFVSTKAGNIGDYQSYLKIVDTPEQMAATADYFLDHPEEKKSYTDRAFDLWGDQYTWSKIALAYEKIIKELCPR